MISDASWSISLPQVVDLRVHNFRMLLDFCTCRECTKYSKIKSLMKISGKAVHLVGVKVVFWLHVGFLNFSSLSFFFPQWMLSGVNDVLPTLALTGLGAEDLRLLLNGCGAQDFSILKKFTYFHDECGTCWRQNRPQKKKED